MMAKERRRSVALRLAAAVILASCFAQTADCSRLKKAERRAGRNDAEVAKWLGVPEGRVVFGRVFKKGSGLESQGLDGTSTPTFNASAGDEAAYQADAPVWGNGETHPLPRGVSPGHMATSLRCGGDQMRFRAFGPSAFKFAVEQQGGANPMPLHQIPSSCGYNVHRNPFSLVMMVPYHGCYVLEEVGNYVLPMSWRGIPVSLLCPKPLAHDPTTAEKPEVPEGPYYPPFFNPNPVFFLPPPVSTAAPTTKKPDVPQQPQFPQFPELGKPATTTTTQAPPLIYPFPFPPYFFPWSFPMLGTAEPTTKQKTTAKPMAAPQFPQNWPFFPKFPFYGQYPFPPFFPPYNKHPSNPEMTTTKPPTTTASPKYPVAHRPIYQHPFLPHGYLPFHVPPPPPEVQYPWYPGQKVNK